MLVFICSKAGFHPQDMECDVSVEDDNRQEWIFTLYDFDNSGKVTKEVCLDVKRWSYMCDSGFT